MQLRLPQICSSTLVGVTAVTLLLTAGTLTAVAVIAGVLTSVVLTALTLTAAVSLTEEESTGVELYYSEESTVGSTIGSVL